MENTMQTVQMMDEATLYGLYLGWVILVSLLGWGLFKLGFWIEEKLHQRYLAKTRSFIKPRGLELWY